MKLKFRPIYLESGRPIAFISSGLAKKTNIPEGSRIEVSGGGRKLILPVNLVKEIIEEDEISFSEEALKFLQIKKGGVLEIVPAFEPHSVHYILKKLNGTKLSAEEIFEIISDIVNNSLNEAEIAYFVSAVYHHGMSPKEILALTRALAKTGRILFWGKKTVADKHCIGGVPGNRTTPLVVSICAAAGLTIPKTSSKSITTAAATADVLDVVTTVSLSPEEMQKVVKKTNGCLVWGGSLGLAPADDKLIRVEKMLNLDPEAQLIASILSKKLAAGSKYVLIDIPFGEGAKVSYKEAKALRSLFQKVSNSLGIKLKVVLTQGNQPIGNAIGPVLEMIDIYRIFRRENSRPLDLEEKALFLAGELLELTKKARNGEGKLLAKKILDSGEALKKFEEIISLQGKKNFFGKKSRFSIDIKSPRSGVVKKIRNKQINAIGRALGCPAAPASGIYLYKHLDDKVKKGEFLLTLYAETKRELGEGISLYKLTKPILVEG